MDFHAFMYVTIGRRHELERGMAGFERGRNLDKLGLHCQDTSELSFTDVAVPKANVLGEIGGGFEYLHLKIPGDRRHMRIKRFFAAQESRNRQNKTVLLEVARIGGNVPTERHSAQL